MRSSPRVCTLVLFIFSSIYNVTFPLIKGMWQYKCHHGKHTMCAAIRKFEEWRKKSAWGYLLLRSSWKRWNTHAHQVSPPCVLQLTSLRSEEVVLKKMCLRLFKQYAVVMETCNRYGNDIIGIHTEFHLYACYHSEVKIKEKCLRLFVVIYK